MSCKKRFLFAVLVGFEIRICKGYLATSPPRRVSADFDARERNVASKLSVARDWTWTIKNLAQWGGIGSVGLVFVGSAATIADTLQEWVEETDVHGCNLAYAVTHETFEDIVNLLAPELQRRGVYPSAYGPGSTLREKLFSAAPSLRNLLSGAETGRRVSVLRTIAAGGTRRRTPKAIDGYVRQDYAIALAEKAGSVFAVSSEIKPTLGTRRTGQRVFKRFRRLSRSGMKTEPSMSNRRGGQFRTKVS